jgi:hypothetical protein
VLLIAAATWLQAQVTIVLGPIPGRLSSMQTLVLRPQVGGTENRGVLWSVRSSGRNLGDTEGGIIQACQDGSFTYSAPVVHGQPRILTLRAMSAAQPAVFAERTLTVVPLAQSAQTGNSFQAIVGGALGSHLPPTLVDLALAYCGQSGLEGLHPSQIAEPFSVLTTTGVFGDPGRTGVAFLNPHVFDDSATPLLVAGEPTPLPLVGYGRQLTIGWPLGGDLTKHLGSFDIPSREGNRWTRVDLTGKHTMAPCMTEDVRRILVETIEGGPGTWVRSLRYTFPQIRGLLPFAGQPWAERGHQDGAGASARLHTPFGLAPVGLGFNRLPGRAGEVVAVVADQGTHTLSLVTRDREVARICGSPGRPGHADGPWDRALFNGPTFVCSNLTNTAAMPFPGDSILIADSGNHCIRTVDADGSVTTLAGTPGVRGDLDHAGSPLTATFNDPGGLAMDMKGGVYVADRGNHRIRMIRDGAVATIAGGQAGHRDGAGLEARFQALQGLACDPASGTLYAADGNCIRRLRRRAAGASEFDVDTVAGSAEGPGFMPEGRPLSRCLNGPVGLAFERGLLCIADTGNRALRVFVPATGSLLTVAGDPQAAEGLRWGLCRDNLPFDPGAGYAALDVPRAFIPRMLAPDVAGVLSGCCIAQVPCALGGQVIAEASSRTCRLTAPAAVPLGEPLRLTLDLEPGAGQERTGSFHYRVEVHDALSGLERRFEGERVFDQPLHLEAEVGERGEATITAALVSQSGISWGERRKVKVQ